MTHNQLFVSNLNRLINVNKKLFFEDVIYKSDDYVFFIKELANKLFLSQGFTQIDLPIVDNWADKGVSTKFGVLITQFNSNFVIEEKDAYFFAIVTDSNANYMVFTLELSHNDEGKIVYDFCEYNVEGKRNVIATKKSCSLECFGSAIYDVLK